MLFMKEILSIRYLMTRHYNGKIDFVYDLQNVYLLTCMSNYDTLHWNYHIIMDLLIRLYILSRLILLKIYYVI